MIVKPTSLMRALLVSVVAMAAMGGAEARSIREHKSEAEVIAGKFEAIVTRGLWNRAEYALASNQLMRVGAAFKTDEGKAAIALQLKKIDFMRKSCVAITTNLVGFTFKESRLKGNSVVSTDEEGLGVRGSFWERGVSTNVAKFTWKKFCTWYPGNYNEVINRCVVNGRKSRNLTPADWAEVMVGVALTLQYSCRDIDGASYKVEMLAKEVVKRQPEYESLVQQFFPYVAFEPKQE